MLIDTIRSVKKAPKVNDQCYEDRRIHNHIAYSWHPETKGHRADLQSQKPSGVTSIPPKSIFESAPTKGYFNFPF
jgi:hypothetical protein